MASKQDIWNQVKQDSSEIYGKPIFDIFIQMASLSLDHYMQLSEKQKEIARIDEAIINACQISNYELIKELMTRDLKRNPENSFAGMLFSFGHLDKQKIEQLIVQTKKSLNERDIFYMIENSQDFKKTASLIGEENIVKFKKEIASHQISSLISRTKNKEELISFLGKETLNNLSPSDVAQLLKYSKSGDRASLDEQLEILRVLGKEVVNKISSFGLSEVLGDSKLSLSQVIKYFGPERIDGLHDNISYRFVQYPKKDDLDELGGVDGIIKTIIEIGYTTDSRGFLRGSQKKISSYLMRAFIIKSENPRQIIKQLGPENIQRLSATGLQGNMGRSDLEGVIKYVKDKDQLSDLFKYLSLKQLTNLLNDTSGSFEYPEIVKLAIKFRELSREDVFVILLYSHYSRQKELIELLGDENINKLNEDDKRRILGRSTGGGSSHINELKGLLKTTN